MLQMSATKLFAAQSMYKLSNPEEAADPTRSPARRGQPSPLSDVTSPLVSTETSSLQGPSHNIYVQSHRVNKRTVKAELLKPL